MAIVSSQLHLETFIENSQNLPAELVRLLNTIRDLDERSQKLREQLESKVQDCLVKPPQATVSSRKNGGDHAQEVADMRADIEADQWMLIQFSDEKLALSNQCYDLVDHHLGNLDKEIEAFEADLQAGERVEADTTYEGEPLRSKRGRGEDRPSASSKAEAMRRAQEAERARIADAEIAAANARQQALLQQQQQNAAQQLQQEQQFEAEQLAAQQAVEAQQVAAHQASSAAAGLQSPYPPMGYGGRPPAVHHSAPIATSRIARTQYKHSYKDPDPEDDETEADTEVIEQCLPQDPGMDMSGMMSPADQAVMAAAQPKALPPHLRHYAPQVQAKGRLLTQHDISQQLEGIRAEMWWPDDKSWYLVEIGEVNMDNQQARVIYTTGEIEEINLNEIARDGHLSIINVQADLW